MTERYSLDAQSRHVIGKQVKQLRAAGMIPGVIYGQSQAPVHVQMNWSQLRVVLLQAGGTNLIDVNVEGKTYTTLVRTVDRHPIRRDVMHIDFYAVDLTHTLHATVPVIMVNEDKVRYNIPGGRVNLETVTLEIECLPGDLIHEMPVDVGTLKSIGSIIHVSDLPAIKGIKIVNDPDTILVRATALMGVEEIFDQEGGSAEPELIAKRKDEEGEE